MSEAEGTDSNLFHDEGWVRHVVREKVATKRFDKDRNPPVLKDWTTEEFVGIGASSKRYVAKLRWECAETGFWNGIELPTKLFMKVPTMTHLNKMNKNLSGEGAPTGEKWIMETHQTECKFYDLWMNESPPLKVLTCYSTEQINGEPGNKPHLIFEDVSHVGMVQSHFDGINLKQLLQIAESFGNLHAWSIKNREWTESFHIPPKENCAFIPPYFAAFANDLKNKFPEYLDGLIDPICAMAGSVESIYYVYNAAEALGLPTVLVHGDCMGGNIFFNKLQDSQDPTRFHCGDDLVALYDWQVVHPGVPGEDFAKLLMTSVDPAVRRKNLDKIFQKYYQSFTRHFRNLTEVPFTYDQVLKSYKYLMKAGFLWGILALGHYAMTEFKENGKSEKFQRAMNRIVGDLEDIRPLYSDEGLIYFKDF